MHLITSSLLYSIEQKQVSGPTYHSKVQGVVIAQRYEHQKVGVLGSPLESVHHYVL